MLDIDEIQELENSQESTKGQSSTWAIALEKSPNKT